MIGAASLARYLGRDIDVFGVEYDADGELLLITNGRLVGIEGDCLALGDDDIPSEAVMRLVDLRLVGLVALRVPSEKPLRVMEGGLGKVYPIRRQEPKGEPA